MNPYRVTVNPILSKNRVDSFQNTPVRYEVRVLGLFVER